MAEEYGIVEDNGINKEKNRIALSSVIAAIFLTSFKMIVGLATGSLGILSEALHSGLDLVAAGVTFFAVRTADKPADHDHNYGHGKIENYSALIETILLVITCFWIVYEAISRIIHNETKIEVTTWSFVVIVVSIVVDFSRSRALMRVAKKYNSQALEADALHFSTDIYSSAVVLIGLVASKFGFHLADPISALMVAIIVLFISYRLGKKSFDVLIDRAPDGLREEVTEIIRTIPDILTFHDLKVRESGSYKFIEVNIHVDSSLSIVEAHDVSDKLEDAVQTQIFNSKITVHIEPDGVE